MKHVARKKRPAPRITTQIDREDYAIRIALKFRQAWPHISPEERVRILQEAAAFLAQVREQMVDEITMLLDGAAGPIDMTTTEVPDAA